MDTTPTAPPALRRGDRIGVRAGARSAHRQVTITRGFRVELLGALPDYRDPLTVEISGFQLTARGAYPAGVPVRDAIVNLTRDVTHVERDGVVIWTAPAAPVDEQDTGEHR